MTFPAAPAARAEAPAPKRFPPEFYLSHLPASHPYRPVLEHLLSASAEDQAALDAHFPTATDARVSSELTAAQQTLVRELTAELVRAASAPATSSADWPLQPSAETPEDIYAGTCVETGPINRLASLAIQSADALPAGQAIPVYAAVAQLSRQQRQGLFLIQQLSGGRLEDQALAAASRRLGELDVASLQTLDQAWRQLAPIPDPRRSLENERDVGFTFFVEAILRPALQELLGVRPAPEDAADRSATFTRDLRLSGLIDYGDGERTIRLENVATGEFFSVSAGRPSHDIQLVRIDFDRHEAHIRRGRREALIQLESKQITERGYSPVPDPVGRLDRMFRDRVPDWDSRRAAWLEKVRTHPGGIEGYLNELTTINDAWYERSFAADRSARRPRVPQLEDLSDDPALRLIAPTVGGTLRILNGAGTRTAMFQAAIQYRLHQLGATGTRPPADPWGQDAEPFAVEPTPDGGFLLRSHYEQNAGQPLTCKYAAPDAGFRSH